MSRAIGPRFIPRVGDVIITWYDTGAFGMKPNYLKVTAVSASGRSIRYRTARSERTRGGWRLLTNLFGQPGGAFATELVRRGTWTDFMGEDEDDPLCPACGVKPGRDEDGLAYACRCTDCARCGRTFAEADDAAPRIAEDDETAARHDPGERGMCELCWQYVTEEEERR